MKLRRSRRACSDGTRSARSWKSKHPWTSPGCATEWCFAILSLRIDSVRNRTKPGAVISRIELTAAPSTGCLHYSLVESAGIPAALPAAESRRGRRTALSLPLSPPPQKNCSPPADSSPATYAPDGCSCIGGDIQRAQRRICARGVEGIQLVSGSKPDMLTVIRDPMYAIDTRKGPIFTDDFGI